MGVYYGMNGLWVPVGGQGSAAPVDPNLLAENIKSGVTISGVTGTFTNDGTATASDMANGVTAYVNGEKVTGIIKKYSNGTWKDGVPTSDGLGNIGIRSKVDDSGEENGVILPYNSNVYTYSPASNFGDATTADVADGKTFTSSAGVKATGEGKLFELNYMGDTESLDERDTSYVNLDFTNNTITIKPYNIAAPISRVTGVDNYAIRIRQSSSDYYETQATKYTSAYGRYLHMEWSGASSPASGGATINFGSRGQVNETWDNTNKQLTLTIKPLEYYEKTSYSVDIYITWEIMHI